MWFRNKRERSTRICSPLLRIHRHDSGNESGQVLLIGAIVSLGLAMVSLTVANVGMMAAEKIHLQDTVDAAAYSAAVVEARYMNLSAYINRAMVANYNSMAFNTALWATVDADQQGLAVTADLLYKLSEVLGIIVITTSFAQAIDSLADGIAAIQGALFELNGVLRDLFSQDETDVNQYLEVYNVYALTMYQGLLYASLQADRYRVIREVAEEMDPEVVTTTVMGVGAEAVSFDEMARAIDWVVNDTDARSGVFNSFNNSFDRMMGTDSDDSDHEFLLAAVTEASLDKFVAGRDRRGRADQLRQFNTQNILDALGLGPLLELPFEIPCIPPCVVACEAACIDDLINPLDDGLECIRGCPSECVDFCDVEILLKLGASMRDFQENSTSRDHVPFITRQRMREVNFFGIDWVFESRNPLFAIATAAINALGFPSTLGTTSGDKKADLANAANAVLALNGLTDFDPIRAFQCTLTGTGCQITFSTPTGGLNAPNMQAAATMLPIPGVVSPPFFIDDHWPGTDGPNPIRSHEFYDPVTGKLDPPEYLVQIITDGVDPGVPRYDWIVDLDNVGFPHYHFDEAGAQARPDGGSRGTNSALAGPSIAVVGTKRADDINGLRGLGIGLEAPNDYPLTAISRAQVYYLRNPNRPDEKPSMFNPHWVPRLAPIDNDDTPTLLREILPFVAGVGITVSPTH